MDNNGAHTPETKNVGSTNSSTEKVEELQKKMQQELTDLQQKYSKISEKVKELQNDKLDVKNSIKAMNDNFGHISKNVENVLSKLDNINIKDKDSNDDQIIDDRIDISMKKIIFNPLRKLTVGVISSILAVTDKVTKVTCGTREKLEDMVAEVQYERRKKHMANMNEPESVK
ncbi:hypothetical protein ACJDU8_22720 [Clostridium sp. WILCCON 0269]|uniref:Viral A-type inclusion protein n=1 Tax=Candidatus Clostridium eludens TaxID=3381663 RepID=A0ABW8ST67_9CLOT